MEFLKVSSKSSPASVAGAIAGLVKDSSPVKIQAVGAGAVNQAIKAVAIARGFLIPAGLDVAITPTFSDIEIDGNSRTAIRIVVHPMNVKASQVGSLADLDDAKIPSFQEPEKKIGEAEENKAQSK